MTEQKSILIVDDDVAFVNSVQDLLEAYGYRVLTASDSDEAIAKAQEEKPDLIILDVMMRTHTEGIELARALSADEKTKDIKLLLVTGVAHAMHLPFALEPDEEWLPVDRIMEKPIAPNVLIAEVEKIFK
jgi:CheY-like chemotaxis protein